MPENSSSHLNQVYSSLHMRRRYEVWFLRLGLVDRPEAWWFRYLLMNPGRDGCPELAVAPVQIWATRFPLGGKPKSFIQGYSRNELTLGPRDSAPFEFRVGKNYIGSDACHGDLRVDGSEIQWDLRYQSHFRATLSNKGWIGFSKTPHSDGLFSGEIRFDGKSYRGKPLGTGVQGHNCGVRHRDFWTWMHAYFIDARGHVSTLETLTYEMPLGMTFRKGVLWHAGQTRTFSRLRESRRDSAELAWEFSARANDGSLIEARIDAPSASTHRLPYFRTNCSGSFEVANNSLANAWVRLRPNGREPVELHTNGGAVLEMAGVPR